MKKTQKKFQTTFERLYKEAVEDDNLFGAEDDVIDDYESDIDEINPEFEDEVGEGEDVTITLSQDQVSVLRDILAQVEGDEGEEEGDEFADDEGLEDEFGGDDDVSDIEELEREAVEFETAPDAESVRNKTKSGKAADNRGDLKKETDKHDGEEKQYKFVKREKPQELKYKTTKGS
jgi:hypothetical protein